jgi:hypothetical protein
MSAQNRFIENIKEGVGKYKGKQVPIEFVIPKWNGKDAPSLDTYYVKPVYVCAPHLNFPGTAIPCKEENCCGTYAGKGWAEERSIYGLSTSVYILQYKYHCNNKHCRSFQCYECTDTIVKTPRCPKFIRQAYENLYYATHKAGVTCELKSFILNDAMSSKGFDDIEFSIKLLQRERYLSYSAEYAAAVEWYCHISDRTPDTFPEFSAIDDKCGYDCKIPSPDYILDIFLGILFLFCFILIYFILIYFIFLLYFIFYFF